MEKYELAIPADSMILPGNLTIPAHHKGLIIFSHGSGSGRFSPRNIMVARLLNEKYFATLLFDLLTEEEDKIFQNRFNIELLSKRLVEVTKWINSSSYNNGKSIGYFGASTGAASALYAASEIGSSIKAIVSRGGRPDLAIPILKKVTTPTLLLIGAMDTQVIELNKIAYEKIEAEKKLIIIEGATHVFEEPGKLEEVAGFAIEWYQKYIT